MPPFYSKQKAIAQENGLQDKINNKLSKFKKEKVNIEKYLETKQNERKQEKTS